MQITVTGHRMDVTDAIRSFAINKISRLEKHHQQITHIDLTFDIEHLDQIAEANVKIVGANHIHVRAKSSNLYTAIDNLVDKLDRKIIQHKEKRGSHRDAGSASQHFKEHQHDDSSLGE